MLPEGLHIAFDPPHWPVALAWAGGAILFLEALAIAASTWRGQGKAWALLMTAGALLAGPLIMAGLAFAAAVAMVTGEKFRHKTMLAASARGTMLLGLAAMIYLWPSGGAVTAITVCGVSWALRGYARTTSPVKPAAKTLLLSLRILPLLLLGLWVLSPALEFHRTREVRGLYLVGIDASASMQQRDMPPRYTDAALQAGEPVRRIDAVNQALQDQARNLAALQSKADVEWFAFSASADPSRPAFDRRDKLAIAPGDSNGSATAIGDSLAAALGPHIAQGRKISGVILFSDGCNNTSDMVEPETQARLMRQRNIPLRTVGVGSETVTGSMRMITVKDLAAPKPGRDEVQRFNLLPITALVDAYGLKDRRIRVTAKFDDEKVGQEIVTVEAAQQTIPVKFSHVPLASGLHRVTVSAECEESVSSVAGIPSCSKLVRVVDNELRVLYVEGKFRYESKYITQALVAANRFTVDRRVLLQGGGADAGGLGEKLEDWLAYHAIIFGDVGPGQFTPRQLEIIKELVGKYGKGFCMIGGTNSLGKGKWAGTPIADIMPVDLDLSGQIDNDIRVVVTPEGLASEVLKIGEEGQGVAAAWARLPVLPGADRLGGIKPAAVVLARTLQDEPLIVSQNYGAGRTLAIAFDTTYRWVLSVSDTAELQRRFWRQVALYLSDPKGHVWITTDKASYDLRRLAAGSEAIEVSAGAEDVQGRPIVNGNVSVTLTPPQGTAVPVGMGPREMQLYARLPAPTTAGIYVLKISSSIAGKPISAEHRFEVQNRDLEAMEMLANHKLLRQLAEITGGQFAKLSDVGAMLRELGVTAQPEKVPDITRLGLAEHFHWPMVAIIITLLCLEWALRKRKGLV